MAKKNNISPERKELAKKLVKELDLKTVGGLSPLDYRRKMGLTA